LFEVAGRAGNVTEGGFQRSVALRAHGHELSAIDWSPEGVSDPNTCASDAKPTISW